jgi:hypothetical protein
VKTWGELMKSLTNENIKTVTIKDMYYHYKSYPRHDEKDRQVEFDRSVIQELLKFQGKFQYSQTALHIRDWHNERLYSVISLQDGTSVYLRMATGYVNLADCSAMGLNQETLRKICLRKITLKNAKAEASRPADEDDEGRGIGTGLKMLLSNEKYKDLKDDDIAFYQLVTGYMTINKSKTMYFVVNQNAGEVLGKILEKPLQSRKGLEN